MAGLEELASHRHQSRDNEYELDNRPHVPRYSAFAIADTTDGDSTMIDDLPEINDQNCLTKLLTSCRSNLFVVNIALSLLFFTAVCIIISNNLLSNNNNGSQSAASEYSGAIIATNTKIISSATSTKRISSATSTTSKPTAATKELTFNTCGDDHQWVYADGKLLGSAETGYHNKLKLTIPHGTSVVGVRVRNINGPAGWVGYFSDGRVTNNASWTCTEVPQRNGVTWTLISFNDSLWKTPEQVLNYPHSCSEEYVARQAQWLWTDPSYYSGGKMTIYCRTTLTKSNSSVSQTIRKDPLRFRLKSRRTQFSWPLEMFHINEWLEVCDDGSDSDRATIATLACLQLGYSGGVFVPPQAEASSYSFHAIWLNNVTCTKHEPSLHSCTYSSKLQLCSVTRKFAVQCVHERKEQNVSDLTFSACANGKLEIFADGNLTGVAEVTAKSNTDIHVTIASNTSVLAVKVTSIGSHAGLAGYLSDDRWTEANTWMCTTQVQDNNTWMFKSFTDAHWLRPDLKIFSGSCSPVPYPAQVLWIGLDSPDEYAANTTTYCRKVNGVTPANATRCDVLPLARVHCGYTHITRSACESKNCCYDATVFTVPWCFYPVSNRPLALQ